MKPREVKPKAQTDRLGFCKAIFLLAAVEAVVDVEDLKQQEVGEHGLKGQPLLALGQVEGGGHDVEVLRRAARERVVLHLRDGEKRHALEVQFLGELLDALGLARKRDEDEEIVRPRRLIDGIELLAPCNLADEDIVVEEEALELLHDVRLHIARSVGKDAVRLVDEAARAAIVACHEFAPRLVVELAQRCQDVAVGLSALFEFHLEHRLHLAEAIEAELLREAHDGSARNGAEPREVMDGGAAGRLLVALDEAPDALVGIAEFVQVEIDALGKLHIAPLLSSVFCKKALF